MNPIFVRLTNSYNFPYSGLNVVVCHRCLRSISLLGQITNWRKITWLLEFLFVVKILFCTWFFFFFFCVFNSEYKQVLSVKCIQWFMSSLFELDSGFCIQMSWFPKYYSLAYIANLPYSCWQWLLMYLYFNSICIVVMVKVFVTFPPWIGIKKSKWGCLSAVQIFSKQYEFHPIK